MEKDSYPVAMVCRLLKVSRSAFYAWQAMPKPRDREVNDAKLVEEIVKVHRDSRGTYGSPRVHAALQREEIEVSRSKVEHPMGAAGISGFVCLAVVLDIGTRLVVGWSMANHMETSPVDEALENALRWRDPEDGLLRHSERGSVYTSKDYMDRLTENGITCSMSRKGECWDNAVMESFFGSYKQECAHRTR